MTPYANLASLGWVVFQDFDAADPAGTSYDYTVPGLTPPLLMGSRFAWTGGNLTPVDATQGPIAQWICWPGVGGEGARAQAQWGQVFAAEIVGIDETFGPFASPILNGDFGSSWVEDATLNTLYVSYADGGSGAIGDVGLVVAGTDLSQQSALFFVGGGGSVPAKVTSQVTSTTWLCDLYEDGYGSSLTQANVTVNQVDLNSFSYTAWDQVAVFKSQNSWYFATEKPFKDNPIPILQLMQITSVDGGGAYHARPVTVPGGSLFGSAVATTELSVSTGLSMGDPVLVFYNALSGLYYIDRRVGSC